MEEELEKLYQDYDFASLYPSLQKKYYYKISMKVVIRKRKIKSIFQ